MGLAIGWRGVWADRGRRIGVLPQLPVAAGLLGLAAAAESIEHATSHNWSVPYTLVLCLVGVATTLPLAFLPVAGAAAIVSAMSVVSLAAFRTLTVAGLGAELTALYRLGQTGSRYSSALLLTPTATVSFLLLALISHPGPETRVLTLLLTSLAPVAAWAGITRRAHNEAATQRAARQALAGSLLEHTARGERARIARELHDVVAHHISMIAVQAETARLATPGMPPAGAQRLSEIGDTARAGLTEMRRLLGVLREDAEADTNDRYPQPSLEQLNELLDDARDATGTGTRLIVHGRPIPLDPGVELAAFRIIQEALTNARRHAPGAAIDVRMDYTESALRLTIRDNGPGPPPGTGSVGHGLLGMRERASAAGGKLQTGAAAGGGFLIKATLPAKVEATE